MPPTVVPTKNTVTNAKPIAPRRGGLGLPPQLLVQKFLVMPVHLLSLQEVVMKRAGTEWPSGFCFDCPQPGLSIRRNGDEIQHPRLLLGCQRPHLHRAPVHQTVVSVNSIHWFSTPMSPLD